MLRPTFNVIQKKLNLAKEERTVKNIYQKIFLKRILKS